MWNWLDYVTLPAVTFFVSVMLLAISYELAKGSQEMLFRVLRPLKRLKWVRRQLTQAKPFNMVLWRVSTFVAWSGILLLVILTSVPQNILDPWKDTIPPVVRLVVLAIWLFCMVIGIGLGIAEATPARLWSRDSPSASEEPAVA